MTHFEWPIGLSIFGLAQTLAWVNLFELMNQSLGVALMLISITWMGVQIWSKIKLTNKALKGEVDDELD